MKTRRALLLTGVIIIAALLAFQLNGVVYAMIVLPVSYLLWLLKMLYFAMPGTLWWTLLILVVLYILFVSLLQEIKFKKRKKSSNVPSKGNVENLAAWMDRAQKGIYFKWLVANRLGRIAHQIIENRFAGKKRSFFDPLTGPGWTADAATQAYLETGLQGSFADYPHKDSYFSKHVQTPLDHPASVVIEYLESQAGNQ